MDFYIDNASAFAVQQGFYLHQLFADTGCSEEDLPGTMDDRDGWCERVRAIIII